MALTLIGTKFDFIFKNYSISASTSRAADIINAYLYVNNKVIYNKQYPSNEVINQSDTQVIQKAASDFLENYTGTDKYSKMLIENYTNIKLLNKEITFDTESCGMQATLCITITKHNYIIRYKNIGTGDLISIDVNANSYAEAVDKVRFYLKDLADCTQVFGIHVNELERNEYVDYATI